MQHVGGARHVARGQRGARRPATTSRSRLLAGLLGALVLFVTVATPTVAAAQTSAPVYAAIGDSFAAGQGSRTRANDCYQSPQGYPEIVATAKGWTLSYLSCSGATVAEVLSRQVPRIPADAQVVTITAGGNDAGYATVLQQCALPRWISHCGRRLSEARASIEHQIPQRLAALYRAVRARAPHAEIYVVGYPRLMGAGDCNLATFLSHSELAAINALADRLDGVIAQAAADAGLRFVDVRPAFANHPVCSSDEWINGFSNPVDESYHPNAEGHEAAAALVLAILGTPQSVTGSPGVP